MAVVDIRDVAVHDWVQLQALPDRRTGTPLVICVRLSTICGLGPGMMTDVGLSTTKPEVIVYRQLFTGCRIFEILDTPENLQKIGIG